jgi:putative Mn2+ efflux pump MntP
MIDIRLPIGLMFTILGVLLALFGLCSIGDLQMYRKSLCININLISGLLMIVFGLLMLWGAITARRKSQSHKATK